MRDLILESPPAVHLYGNGKTATGGFSKPDLIGFERIVQHSIKEMDNRLPARVIETGCGLSTLIFLNSGCYVSSFALDDSIERTKIFLRENNCRKEIKRWSDNSGQSERILHHYVSQGKELAFDIALIDGNHALPTVFSDFTAFNIALRQKGLLIIDDIGLPGPNILYQTLLQFPKLYELCSYEDINELNRKNKWVVFRKLTRETVLCGNYPFLKYSFDDPRFELPSR